MIFSSSIFLFAFLPLFLGVYYLTPVRYRSAVILLGSYAFYAWWRVDFLLLFIAVTLWNYFIGIKIHSAISRPRAKYWLTIGLIGNLSTLAYFKYADFGIDSLNHMIVLTGGQPLTLANVILPIGISFYIFQSISYLIDVYRKDTPPTSSFVDFAAFIALFPQLIAGPVLRYKDLAHQFQNREHNLVLFASGVLLFMTGFIKKVLIADTVAPLADAAFSNPAPSMADAWVGALAYSVQLYFDFSGYSDMAIGLGLMMGFRFIYNFNQPYISQSITEFWQRWHISLSTWLRDYLYIPLGGNRNGTFKTYRNLFLTMLLGGLWHGANWTFVVWGCWHGIWLAIERATGRGRLSGFNPFAWLFTMLLVIIGWVVFRAESLSQALVIYRAMFLPDTLLFSASYQLEVKGLQLVVLVVAVTTVMVSGLRQHNKKLENFIQGGSVTNTVAVMRLPIFILALSSLVASDYSPFLYFQF